MRQRNEWFEPDAVASLYRLYFAPFAVAGLAGAAAPFVLGDLEWWIPASLLAGVFLVAGFVFWWAGAYARTAGYRLTDTEVEYRGGIWFRSQSTVPYARITNVQAKQGPVSRLLGVGHVAIQTAGASGQASAELTMRALSDYEELRGEVLAEVSDGGDATGGRVRESAGEVRIDSRSLERLVEDVHAIRKRLEE